MSALRLAAFILVVTAWCAAPPLGAQEFPFAADHPGSWSEPDIRGASMPPAARAAALAVAQQLVDILRRMPAMTPGPGFQVVQHTSLSLENVDHSSNSRLPTLVTIQLTANIAPYERTAAGIKPNERDTAASVTIAVNDFSYTGTTPMGEAWSDEQGAFIQNPEDPVETKHGFPVYQEGNGDKWLLMRRGAVPVLAAVNRERYLLCATKQAEEALARAQERRAKIPSGVPNEIVAEVDNAIAHQKTHLANLRQQYQSMSSSDRRLPAVVGVSGGDEPLKFGSDGTAFFYFNPALIDTALPPATPQALAIRVLSNDEHFPGLGDKLDQQLDWPSLARLLR